MRRLGLTECPFGDLPGGVAQVQVDLRQESRQYGGVIYMEVRDAGQRLQAAGWRRYVLATALMPVAVFGLMFICVALASDPGDPLYSVGGLVQRVLIAVAFGWITTTGWRLLRRPVEGEQNAARTL